MPVNPYTEVTVSNYNANPPPNNGSDDSSNVVDWNVIKTKLSDPLKTALEQVDDNVLAAFSALITDFMPISDMPAFAATASASQVLSNQVWEKVEFPSETFDKNSDYDAGASRWTPCVEGLYLISANVSADPAGASGNFRYEMALYKNGSFHAMAGHHATEVGGAGEAFGNSGAWVVEANGSTDYFEIFMYNPFSSGTLTVRGGSGSGFVNWSGVRVR